MPDYPPPDLATDIKRGALLGLAIGGYVVTVAGLAAGLWLVWPPFGVALGLAGFGAAMGALWHWVEHSDA